MLTLQTKNRDTLGKKVRTLRDEGLIPAELYGHGTDNLHLTVAEKEFNKVFKEAGESTVVVLKTDSQGDRNVLIHDIQEDPLTGMVMHVDFYEVRMDEKLTATVPLRFIGEAPAVKEKEGVLVRAIQELEVEALPADLPPEIEVDLAKLDDIGASIRVSDLAVSDKVKILVDAETVVVTVVPPVVEEVITGPVSVEEVKVEGEEKRKEKEAEAQAEGEAKE